MFQLCLGNNKIGGIVAINSLYQITWHYQKSVQKHEERSHFLNYWQPQCETPKTLNIKKENNNFLAYCINILPQSGS